MSGGGQLDEVKAQFDAASARAKQLLTSNGVETLTRRPQPDRWSAAECVAHLTLTNQHYPPLNRGALEKATITSPFSKRMRYNAYSCFQVLAARERRHLWQAEQALAGLR